MPENLMKMKGGGASLIGISKMAPFRNDSSMLLKWETSAYKKLRISEEGNGSLSVMRSFY